MENNIEVVNFDETFKSMIFAMRLNKCHPDIPRDMKWICQFLVMHGFFFFVFCLLIYSIIFHDLKNGDITQACANGIISIIFIVVTLNYCVMLRYQRVLKGMMEEIKTDYVTAKCFSPAEQSTIRKYARKGKKIVRVWIVITICTGSLFLLKSFFLMIYYLIKGEFRLVPLYDITYPSPIEEKKREPLVYFFLYLMFLIYDGYAMIMYVCMPALGPVMMLHSCGQLEIVKRRIMDIFKENDSEKILLKKLNDIVKKLQNIYSFVDRIQESSKIMYELTLKAAVIILPISFYQIIQSYKDNELRIEFITIIIGAIVLCSVPCYYSDQLMDQGESVRLAVYMCGWEKFLYKNKSLKTTLMLIHTRASRSIGIRTMFRTISLDALTDIYHQSYAIFNVLNASSH